MKVTRKQLDRIVKSQREIALEESSGHLLTEEPLSATALLIWGAIALVAGSGLAAYMIGSDTDIEDRARAVDEEGLHDAFALWQSLRGIDMTGSGEKTVKKVIRDRSDDLAALSREFSRVLEIVEDSAADKPLAAWLESDDLDEEAAVVLAARQGAPAEPQSVSGVDVVIPEEEYIEPETETAEWYFEAAKGNFSGTLLRILKEEMETFERSEKPDYAQMWIQFNTGEFSPNRRQVMRMMVWKLSREVSAMLDMGVEVGDDILELMRRALHSVGLDTSPVDESQDSPPDVQREQLLGVTSEEPESPDVPGSGLLGSLKMSMIQQAELV